MTTEATATKPSIFPRVTEIALVVNAVLHAIGSVGFLLGVGPHADPVIARRVVAAGFAAIVMFVVTATRVRRDAGLIVMPLAFVFCNLADSLYELATTHEMANLPPAVVEATFFAIYARYFLMTRR